MLMLLFSLMTSSFAQSVHLRNPDVSLDFFQSQLTKFQSQSFANATAEQLLKSPPDTSAMDPCLEALAVIHPEREARCFQSVQLLKNELWTPPLRRVLIAFFERLSQETEQHRKLYLALRQSLEQQFTLQKMSGVSDLAFRDHRLFLKWLSEQSEWQDARIFVNGSDLAEASLLDHQMIAQWFVISNAGRSLAFIGTQRDFQKFLQQADDFRFLDCQSVSKNAFSIDEFVAVTYVYSETCLVSLKRQSAPATSSLYQRWQASQAADLSSQQQLEKPALLPKWAIPVVIGLAIGAVALRGKKISIRAPEF